MQNHLRAIKLLLLVCTCSLAFSKQSYAQLPVPSEPEKTFQNWTMMGESRTMIDVYYRVLKCGAKTQVHFFVFNENTIDQTANFSIDLIDGSGSKLMTKTYSIAAKKLTMYKALCGGTDEVLNSLKVDLPEGVDPAKVTAKITFQP
jgi:hypothetical protein